jgi:hypothetical protein
MHNVNVLVSVLFSVAINQKVGKCFHFDYIILIIIVCMGSFLFLLSSVDSSASHHILQLICSQVTTLVNCCQSGSDYF